MSTISQKLWIIYNSDSITLCSNGDKNTINMAGKNNNVGLMWNEQKIKLEKCITVLENTTDNNLLQIKWGYPIDSNVCIWNDENYEITSNNQIWTNKKINENYVKKPKKTKQNKTREICLIDNNGNISYSNKYIDVDGCWNDENDIPTIKTLNEKIMKSQLLKP